MYTQDIFFYMIITHYGKKYKKNIETYAKKEYNKLNMP